MPEPWVLTYVLDVLGGKKGPEQWFLTYVLDVLGGKKMPEPWFLTYVMDVLGVNKALVDGTVGKGLCIVKTIEVDNLPVVIIGVFHSAH